VPFTFQVLQKLRQRLDATTPQCGSPACTCHFGQSFFAPLPETVGFTSIFTKRDEVVDWRACLDERGDNRQVSGGHLSLAVNHEVYRILADLLASLLARHETAPEASANGEGR
jgi:hypothetical protein